MSIAFLVFLSVMVLVILAFIRIEVVYAARRTQADETRGWKDNEDFNKQVLDIRKWTHSQFYPKAKQ